MKLLIILAAITLSLATASPAFAFSEPARATELPNYMLGHWCFNKLATQQLEDDSTNIYSKAKDFDECANRGGMKLWRRGNRSGYVSGRFDYRARCKINKVKPIHAGSYLMHADCRDDAKVWTEHFELSRQSEETLLLKNYRRSRSSVRSEP